MKSILPICVLLASLMVVVCRSENVRIGAILSSHENQNLLRDFVARANKRSDVKNAGLTFNVTSQIMHINGIKSTFSMCREMFSKQVHVVIASHPPASDIIASDKSLSPINLSYASGSYGIPMIGIFSRDSALSYKDIHPSFMRTVPPYFHQASVWIDLLNYFNWTEVIFIHGMDEEGRSIHSRFVALAAPYEIKIETKVEFPVGISNFTELLMDLPSCLCRIILLSAGKEDAESLFRDAANLKLTTGSEFVWLVTEETMKAYNVPNGVVGFELANGTNESAHLEDSVNLIVTTMVDLFESKSMVSINDTPASCGPKKEEDNWEDGITILEHMKSQTIEGLTGHLQFDDKGDRLEPIYYMMNKWHDTVNLVGFHGRKNKEASSFSVNGITWPNGLTDRPLGVIKISRHLQVVTIESRPFVYTWPIIDEEDEEKCEAEGIKCSHTNATTGETRLYCCKGYCMDMLRMLSVKLKFGFDLHLSSDNKFGAFKRKIWTGMVGELVNDNGIQSDMVVAPLTINEERSQAIDFSEPFKNQGLTILVKREQKDSSYGSFLQPFQDTLWILMALAVHVIAAVLYFLDKFSPFSRFKLKDDTEEDALNLSSAMWFSWGVLLNSGIGEGKPRSFSACVLGMTWAGFATIMVASYTANLAAFLVLNRPDAYISGIYDPRLRSPTTNIRYATVRDSAVEMYFKRMVQLTPMYRNMEESNYDNADDAIKDVTQGINLQAFIWDSPQLDYEATTTCDLVVAGELFGRSPGLAVGLRKGSPWTRQVSRGLSELRALGEMEKLDNKWILVKHTDCPEVENVPMTLELSNVAGLFILVAGGIVAGVFLIFVEIQYKKHRVKQKELELARNAADCWRATIARRKSWRQTMRKGMNPRNFPVKKVPVDCNNVQSTTSQMSGPMLTQGNGNSPSTSIKPKVTIRSGSVAPSMTSILLTNQAFSPPNTRV